MKKPAQYTLSSGTHVYNYHLPNFVIVVIYIFANRNSILTVLFGIYQNYWKQFHA